MKIFISTTSLVANYYEVNTPQTEEGPIRIWSPAPGSTQEHSKFKLCLTVLSKCSLSSIRSGPRTLPWAGNLFHAHCPLVQTLSLTPAAPPLTQLHAVPSGPVAVTQSRAQRCPSAPSHLFFICRNGLNFLQLYLLKILCRFAIEVPNSGI